VLGSAMMIWWFIIADLVLIWCCRATAIRRSVRGAPTDCWTKSRLQISRVAVRALFQLQQHHASLVYYGGKWTRSCTKTMMCTGSRTC
jgi:hypothetical protein